MTKRMQRRGIPAVLAALGLLLAGCGSSTTQMSGPGAMGGAGQAMAGGSAYHDRSLTCSAPSGLAGQTVRVSLADMGMTHMMSGVAPMGAHMRLTASPTTVSAGQVSFVVSNLGWRTHELVILPLAKGATAGQRVPGADGKVSETGSLGESSRSCGNGTGDGITSGSVGWTTVTLAPGHYELVCNLANHYVDGMYQELDVV